MKKTVKILAALLALSCFLVSCGSAATGDGSSTLPSEQDTGSQASGQEPEGDEMIYFVENGQTAYTVVRPESDDKSMMSRVVKCYQNINNATGAKLGLSDDWVKRGEAVDSTKPEILIGETNRAQSQQVMAGLADCTFAISVVDNKLVICGTSRVMLLEALDYFENNILTDPAYVNSGVFCLEKDFSYVSQPYPATIPNLVRPDREYETVVKRLGTFPRAEHCNVVQGGCSDGTYFYQTLMTSTVTPEDCVIEKIDMKTLKVVKRSAILHLGHSNDFTYNPNTHQIVISYCSTPYNNRAYFVDPDTLEITGYQELDYGFYAIAYCPERDQYVTARNGGQYFSIYDKDFKPVNVLTVKPTGYTTQGIECDENYIYCVQYTKNVVLVYTWEGKLVSETLLKYGNEPENVMMVDGKMYVACNNNDWTGGEIITVDFVPKK